MSPNNDLPCIIHEHFVDPDELDFDVAGACLVPALVINHACPGISGKGAHKRCPYGTITETRYESIPTIKEAPFSASCRGRTSVSGGLTSAWPGNGQTHRSASTSPLLRFPTSALPHFPTYALSRFSRIETFLDFEKNM